MDKRLTICAILFFNVFPGCYKNHFYVQQEWIDRDFLASTHVSTPDPRQESPPEGQRLLISWQFPTDLYEEQLRLAIKVRFWDNTEELINYPVEKRWSHALFYFPKRSGEGKILTYRIQVINRYEEVQETWEHHFWTELIDIDRSNASVSSHPKQESVIETP